MSLLKLFLSISGLIAALIGGGFVAEYLATPRESVWIAAAVGLFVGLIASFASHPIMREAVRGRYLPENDRKEKGIWGELTGAALAVAIAYFLIVWSQERSVGNADYFPPFMGGFLLAQAIENLSAYFRRKTSLI